MVVGIAAFSRTPWRSDGQEPDVVRRGPRWCRPSGPAVTRSCCVAFIEVDRALCAARCWGRATRISSDPAVSRLRRSAAEPPGKGAVVGRRKRDCSRCRQPPGCGIVPFCEEGSGVVLSRPSNTRFESVAAEVMHGGEAAWETEVDEYLACEGSSTKIFGGVP